MSTIINEQKMIEESIFKYEEKLKSPIRRFIDKKFVPVKYFHVKANDTTVDPGFGDVAEILGKDSPVKFQKIDGFPLYGIDTLMLQINNEDQGLDTSFESEAIIMAGTLRPVPNDYFMINHLHDSYIFRVTAVEFDQVTDTNCYKINYILEYIDKELEEQLDKQTDGSFTCILENIGTDERCIIETDLHAKLEEIDRIYDDISSSYMTFYYNERYNCFLADFGNGRKLFDPFQLEFIMKNELFRKKNQIDSLFLTEQFEDNRRKIKYQKTIYRFFETRKMDKLDRFEYTVFPGINNQQTAFYRWIDKNVDILDIPRMAESPDIQRYFILSEDYVNSIRMNAPVHTEVADLILRYARGEELTVDDIKPELSEEVMDLDDSNLEVFFLTPILMFVIRQIVSTSLRKTFEM